MCDLTVFTTSIIARTSVCLTFWRICILLRLHVDSIGDVVGGRLSARVLGWRDASQERIAGLIGWRTIGVCGSLTWAWAISWHAWFQTGRQGLLVVLEHLLGVIGALGR